MTSLTCHHRQKNSKYAYCSDQGGGGFIPDYSTTGWASVDCDFCLEKRKHHQIERKKKEFFWVEIKKSSLSTYWYADMIGHLFQVKRCKENPQSYEVISGCAYIQKADCWRVEVEITVKGRK